MAIVASLIIIVTVIEVKINSVLVMSFQVDFSALHIQTHELCADEKLP